MDSDQGLFDERITEGQNPNTVAIDRATTLELVELLNAEDKTVATAVAAQSVQLAAAIDLAVAAIQGGGRLIYVGAGTSGRLGVLDASEMPPTFGVSPDLIQGIIAGGAAALTTSQEGAEDRSDDGRKAIDGRGVGAADFVLGIAAGGTTPFVHGALARARELGAHTGFLLCTTPSPELLARHDVVIAPLVGPEAITGSTRLKAGTATKLCLNTISTGAMVKLGKTWGNLMVDLQITCDKLRDRGERIIRLTTRVDADTAHRLLTSSQGSVKTAIAMQRLGVDADSARARLAAAGGSLAALIGAPDS